MQIIDNAVRHNIKNEPRPNILYIFIALNFQRLKVQTQTGVAA